MENNPNSKTINSIGTAFLVIGIISAIVCGFIYKVPSSGHSLYVVEYSYNWTLCIFIIVSSIVFKICFAALACIARASEETTMMVYRLMEKLSDNKETDKTKSDTYSKNNIPQTPKQTTITNTAKSAKAESNTYKWVCPKCNKINYHYVTTCTCGEAKPFEEP